MARFTLHASLSTLHSPRFTLHTPHFTLHAPHFTLHAPRFTLHAPRFTLKRKERVTKTRSLFVIVGYRYWGIWGTGLAITLAHLAEFLIINGYARWRYQYKQSSTVMKYGAIHLLIGLSAFILTITADEVVYWLLGGVLIIVSTLFSLWVLNQNLKSSSTSTRL